MSGGGRPVDPSTGIGNRLMKAFRQAFALHRQGRLADAERLYRDVLTYRPGHSDALHYLGVLESQRGNHAVAVELMDRAISANPLNAAARYNRANTLRTIGRFEEALAGYDETLGAQHDNIAAHNNRGTVLHMLHRYTESLASYDRALTIKSDFSSAHANRGNALVALGRYAEALESYDRALAVEQDHLEALYGRGNALAKLKRYEEAIEFYDRALGLAPDDPDILNNRGNALCQVGRYEAALASLDHAIAKASHNPEAWSNRGNAFMELRRFAEALESYRQALALNAVNPEALYGSGSALVELKRHDEAIAAFELLLRGRPDYPYALGMLVYARKTCCDWRNEDAATALAEGIRDGRRVSTPMVMLAISDSTADKLRCSQIVIRDRCGVASPPLWRGEIYRHDRIRVAYLSADFRIHPVAASMAGVFEHHDRARFETFAVSYGLDDGSAMRERLKQSFERFIDVRGKGDKDVASLVRQLEADIAVDLTGMTASGRPGILSLRSAPVQVGYLGFAGSLGSDTADYIIADRTVIPDEQKAYYAEKIAYLPDSFLPHDSKRAIAPSGPSRADMGLPEGGFVFASFNTSYKFAPRTFDVWMRLLAMIEGSVLWLPSSNPAAARNLKAEAQARGVAAERIVFAPYVALGSDHLARLSLADLFLDTLPYNAHATAIDALWAGLPLLTCRGESFASRVAASLLHAAGVPELITDTLENYEALGLRLARDPSALAAVTSKLRRNRTSCALFDTRRFTRHLEAAYRTMWERTQCGERPETFSVMPVAAP